MKLCIKRSNGDVWELEGTPAELCEFVAKNWYGFFPATFNYLAAQPAEPFPNPACNPVINPGIWCGSSNVAPKELS